MRSQRNHALALVERRKQRHRLVECTCKPLCTAKSNMVDHLDRSIQRDAHPRESTADISSFHLLHRLIFVRWNKRILCAILCARAHTRLHIIGKGEKLSVKSSVTAKSHINWTKPTNNNEPFGTLQYTDFNAQRELHRVFYSFHNSMCARLGSEW